MLTFDNEGCLTVMTRGAITPSDDVSAIVAASATGPTQVLGDDVRDEPLGP